MDFVTAFIFLYVLIVTIKKIFLDVFYFLNFLHLFCTRVAIYVKNGKVEFIFHTVRFQLPISNESKTYFRSNIDVKYVHDKITNVAYLIFTYLDTIIKKEDEK